MLCFVCHSQPSRPTYPHQLSHASLFVYKRDREGGLGCEPTHMLPAMLPCGRPSFCILFMIVSFLKPGVGPTPPGVHPTCGPFDVGLILLFSFVSPPPHYASMRRYKEGG